MGASSGSPAVIMMVVFFEPVRPALSVTTRLTTKLPALAYGCGVILLFGPLHCTGTGGPFGQWMTAVLSPKFQATSVIVWPWAVVDELASNTTISFRLGAVGENVKPAVGAGGLPTEIVVTADV